MNDIGLLGLLGWYAVASVVTFCVYWVDKRKAELRAWRVPEKTLHTLALVGGWPGALLAVKKLRHKSSKPSFLVVLWAIAGLHVLLWGWLMVGGK